MKKGNVVWTMIAMMAFMACKKDPVTAPPAAPEVEQTDLRNREVRYNGGAAVLDLDRNGEYDLIFGVILVGDPIAKIDKTQFLVTSGFNTSLAVNDAEQTPPLQRLASIPVANIPGYNWYNGSGIVLMEKHENNQGQIQWLGNWKDSRNMYLPVQVMRGVKRYSGWVELSADPQAGRIILHRAGISRQAETAVRAGL